MRHRHDGAIIKALAQMARDLAYIDEVDEAKGNLRRDLIYAAKEELEELKKIARTVDHD